MQRSINRGSFSGQAPRTFAEFQQNTGQQTAIQIQQAQTVPQTGFRQDVRAYNPRDPRQLSRREPVNTLCLVLICLVLFIVIVAVVIIGFSLQGITNRNQSGCTLCGFENFERGFGSDDGSCFITHSFDDDDRLIEDACPPTTAAYFDLGGETGGYKYVDPDDDDDDPYSTITSFQASDLLDDDDDNDEKSLCFTISEFDVVGTDPTCQTASFNVTGSVSSDGIYCNENPFPSNEICVDPGATIHFNFTTDGSTDGDGWKLDLQCGIRGCTSQGFTNFNPNNTIEDGSCFIEHPTTSDDVIFLCGEGVYSDHEGLFADYQNKEFVQTIFNSSEVNTTLCFEFFEFDVEERAGSCADFLFVFNANDSSIDGRHCNGASTLMGEKVCSKVNEAIYFGFSSDDMNVGAGFGANVTCVPSE